MRAVRYETYGPSSVLRVHEIDAPRPQADQVRIRVGASSVNPIDAQVRAGLLADVMSFDFPTQVGFDAAGVVDEIGDDVTGVGLGDRVFGLTTGGGAAEFTILRAWAPTPERTTDAIATSAALAGMTAVKAIDQLQPARHSRLLIVGAGGGVGSIAMQAATARGHAVTGVASPDDQAYIENTGAAFVASGPGLADRLRASGVHIDAILDATSGGALAELVGVGTDPAHMLTISGTDAAAWGARAYDGRAGEPTGPLRELADLLARDLLQIRVAATLSLSEAAEAHDRIEAGHVGGRIVLVP